MTEEDKVKLTEEISEQIKILGDELKIAIEEQKKMIRIYIDYRSIGDNSQRKMIENLCLKYNIKLNEVENGL